MPDSNGEDSALSGLMVFGGLAILLYLVAAGLIVTAPNQGTRPATASPDSKLWHRLPGWGAAISHTATIAPLICTEEGINFAFLASLSLAALILVTLLLIGSLSKPLIKLGIVVFPLAALTVLLVLLYPPKILTLQNLSLGLEAHILASILSYCLLNIAALQAIVLAVQDWQLRSHHPNRLLRALPPLQTMESLLFQMISIGFVLLTLSLLSGSIYIEDLMAQHLVHKIVLSAIAWLVFATLLWGRLQHGWRGRVAIRWTLSGFFALLLAYFGSKMVLEIILQRV